MGEITKFLSIPFKDGGRGYDGADCFGLAKLVFKHYGIDLPDYKVSCYKPEEINAAVEQEKSKWIKCTGELPVPCLIAIRNHPILCNHVGVYIGNGQFIHITEKQGVRIERVDSPLWGNRIEGYYIPNLGGE